MSWRSRWTNAGECLNPRVAPPEMKLLELSILEGRLYYAIVCYYIPADDMYEIVDGFHRYQVMLRNREIRERERGICPLS